MDHAVLLFGAGLIAGTLNAAAGGGSFITLPSLIYAGLPPVTANASSTVALFPGSITSNWVFRNDYRDFGQITLKSMLLVSMAGGLAGALLLLFTPTKLFDGLLPWLMLIATATFGFGRKVASKLRGTAALRPGVLLAGQFVLGIYTGYFGGAGGIMMLALWGVFGYSDMLSMSAARTLMMGAANAVAALCFVVSGRVSWPETLLVFGGAVIGGYVGARIARRLPPEILRGMVTVFGCVMTVVFFYRAYRNAF